MATIETFRISRQPGDFDFYQINIQEKFKLHTMMQD